MSWKKLVTVLSLAVVVSGLALPAFAQEGSKAKSQNPYLQAEVEDQALRTTVTEFAGIGTLIRNNEEALPERNAATSTNWPLYSSDVKNTRYVDLDQIKVSNVKSLVPVWIHQEHTTGNVVHRQNEPAQAALTVVDGVMYVCNFSGDVWALNAETGRQIWLFRVTSQIASNEVPGLGGNKGAIYGDGILYSTAGSTIIALDAKTGVPVATFGNGGRVDAVLDYLKIRYPDVKLPRDMGYYMPNTVQYYKGIVISAAAVTEANPSPLGGIVQALDAKTGKTLWSYNTIPQGPTDEGWALASQTWVGTTVGTGPRSGGSLWQTPAVDAETNLLLLCSSNPSPLPDGSRRAGSNFFTDSIIALDLATGKMKKGWGFDYDGDKIGDGFFQAVHHDIWDYDWAQNPILFDTTIDGKAVKGVASANKNGMLYMFDRTNGKALFGIFELPVQATSNRPGEKPWPTQPYPFNMNGSVMNTVPLVPTLIPQSVLDSGFVPVAHYTPPLTVVNAAGASRQIITPNTGSGGQTGAPAASSPRTNMLYFAGIDNPSGGGRPGRSFVTAWDMSTGNLVWTKIVGSNVASGAGCVATAGDLLFVGEAAGVFHAYNARTGEELWNFYTGGQIKGSPTVFMLDGREYVSVKTAVTVATFALPKE